MLPQVIAGENNDSCPNITFENLEECKAHINTKFAEVGCNGNPSTMQGAYQVEQTMTDAKNNCVRAQAKCFDLPGVDGKAWKDGNGYMFTGNSLAINAVGETILDMDSREGYGQAIFSYEELVRYREKFPSYIDADSFTLHL